MVLIKPPINTTILRRFEGMYEDIYTLVSFIKASSEVAWLLFNVHMEYTALKQNYLITHRLWSTHCSTTIKARKSIPKPPDRFAIQFRVCYIQRSQSWFARRPKQTHAHL